MTEQRPLPEFGEYATPEEQRERMGLPPVAEETPGVSEGAAAGVAATVAPAHSAIPAPTATQNRYSPPPPEFVPDPLAKGSARVRRVAAPGQGAGDPGATGVQPRGDRGVSIMLMIFGVVSMWGYIGAFQSLSRYVQLTFDMFDLGTITNATRLNIVGWVTLAIIVALLVGTILLTLRRVRSNRLSWFIPVIGGAVAAVVGFIALGIAMTGEPAFLELVNSGVMPTPAS